MRLLTTLLLIAFLGVAIPARAQTPPLGDHVYDIYRNGSHIGTRTLTLSQQDEFIVANIATDLEVKVAFITVFDRTERQRAVWHGDELVDFSSAVDDNGDETRVEITRKDEQLVVTGPAGNYEAPADTVPGTYWNVRTTRASRLINVKNGRLLDIGVAQIGEEVVDLGAGKSVPATHYKQTGDQKLDIWFDNDGIVVRVVFDEGDAEIEFRRRPAGADEPTGIEAHNEEPQGIDPLAR